MDPEDEIFVVEVEGMIQTLLLLIEAYKADIITLTELVQALVDILYQDNLFQ